MMFEHQEAGNDSLSMPFHANPQFGNVSSSTASMIELPWDAHKYFKSQLHLPREGSTR